MDLAKHGKGQQGSEYTRVGDVRRRVEERFSNTLRIGMPVTLYKLTVL